VAQGFTIYHNPRCTTSRKTLDLLRDKLGNGFHVNEYPETRAHLFSIARTCNY